MSRFIGLFAGALCRVERNDTVSGTTAPLQQQFAEGGQVPISSVLVA